MPTNPNSMEIIFNAEKQKGVLFGKKVNKGENNAKDLQQINVQHEALISDILIEEE